MPARRQAIAVGLRLFTSMALILAGIVFAHAAERVALVIGNGAYRNTITLPNPPHDARAIANLLRGLNFEVIEGEDLTKAALDEKLREFAKEAEQAKVTFVFYAGHGMQVNGKNYLIPIDAKLADATAIDFETVDVDRVINFARQGNGVAIVLLDACRDNPLSRRFARSFVASRSAVIGQGLAEPKISGGGVVIGFATAPGEEASDGAGGHSPFTAALLKHLATPGLEIQLALTRVTADVYAATKGAQEPWHNSSLRAEFYLNRAAAAKQSQVATVVPVAPPAPTAITRTISLKVKIKGTQVHVSTPREKAPRVWKKSTTRKAFSAEVNLENTIVLKDDKVFVGADDKNKPGIFIIECGRGYFNSDSDFPRIPIKNGGSSAGHLKCKYEKKGDIYDISFGMRIDDSTEPPGIRRASYLRQEWEANLSLDADKCHLLSFNRLFELSIVNDQQKLMDALHTFRGKMTSGECSVAR